MSSLNDSQNSDSVVDINWVNQTIHNSQNLTKKERRRNRVIGKSHHFKKESLEDQIFRQSLNVNRYAQDAELGQTKQRFFENSSKKVDEVYRNM